jgi:hypothetical protein
MGDEVHRPPGGRWWTWATVVALLFAVTATAVDIIPRNTRNAAAVPADLCALLPTDLLNLLVPSARERNKQVDTTHGYFSSSSCAEASGTLTYPDDRTVEIGSLNLLLSRDGGSGSDSPARRARSDFIAEKQHNLDHPIVIADQPSYVRDLAGLGDSAYLVINVVVDSDSSHAIGDASLWVLFGDATLSVEYIAHPSTQAKVESGAVEVARALIGRLQ